ncbi:MAG: DUF5777 family beta-barrel protein [Candidatus Cloacimonadaceae bacterium]|nr:DUF5777 family beta-barrel protein [Candidatus Cloacimonadaceae bacterium]
MKTKAMLWLLLICAPLMAYQDNGFTLFTPTALSQGDAEVNINHRFSGAVDNDVWNTLFGMNAGANVGFGFRRNFIYQLEGKASYTRAKKRVELGASWRPTPVMFPIAAQIDAAWFSFEEPGIEERRNNFFVLASVQNRIGSERATLTLNGGYDAYYERFIGGVGLCAKLTPSFALVGEYYPVLDRDSAPLELQNHLGERDAFAFGIKLDTWGHQFLFSLSNSLQNHPATMSLGTDDSGDLHFGFNIQRRF